MALQPAHKESASAWPNMVSLLVFVGVALIMYQVWTLALLRFLFDIRVLGFIRNYCLTMLLKFIAAPTVDKRGGLHECR